MNLTNKHGNDILMMGNKKASDSKRRKSNHRRETIIDHAAVRETALGKSFWGGVFGLVGIHNHSDTVYADIKASTKDIEPPEQANKKLAELCLVNPGGRWKLMWDVFIGLSILYSTIFIPFSIGFLADNDESSVQKSLDIAVDALFLLDILITFQTPFVCRTTNILVTDRTAIAKNYISFWFFIDFAGSGPVDHITRAIVELTSSASSASNISSIRLLRVLRLARLAKLFRILTSQNMKDLLERFRISPSVMSVVFLIFQIFLIAHILSCFWFYIATDLATGGKSPNDPNVFYSNPTWIIVYGCDQYDTVSQYILALFWTFQTLLSVGYGDTHPVNTLERAYGSLVMLIGCLMFGSIVAKVGGLLYPLITGIWPSLRVKTICTEHPIDSYQSSLTLEMVESRNLQARESRLKMEEFSALLEKHHMPLRLKRDAKEAYLYYLKERPSVAQSNFWSELPLQLRLKLVNDRFYREIQAIRLFQDGDAEFVSQLIVRSKPYKVLAGQLIHDVGDIAEEISFILEGSVRITIPGFTDELVGCGTVGGYFGELEFYKTSTRTARYVALHDCTLLGVEYSCLAAAVEDNPAAGSEFLLEIELRYNVFQEVSKNTFLSKSCAARSRSVFVKGEGHTVTGSTAASGSVTPANPSSVRSRKGSHPRTPRKTSLSLPADLLSGAYHMMEGRVQPPMGHGLSLAGQLSNNGHLVEATSLDEVHASILSKTTRAIRYKVLMVDREGLERTDEMTPNELGVYWFIHPRDVRKNKWDVFLGILVIYSVLNTPVQLAFASYQPGVWPIIVDLLIDVFFFFDWVLNCNMVYFSDPDSAYVAVRWRIMKRYLTSWFLVDLLSFFPLSLCLTAVLSSQGASSSNLTTIQLLKSLRLVRLLKLFQTVNIPKTLSVLEESLNINANALSLATTILQVLLISHMVCCLWWGLCTAISTSTWYDDTAMVYDTLRLSPFSDQYIASLYFSITTLTTTGYGDIIPVNSEERIVAIFIMVIGASVFGYVVANVAVLVTGSSLLEVLASRRVNILKEFLLESKCNSNLTAGVLNHFIQASKVTRSTDGNAAYDALPTALRDKILFHVNREALDQIPLFRHISNVSVQLYLLSLMTVKVGGAGRCLIKNGKSGSEIFFLVEGDAAIYQVLDSSSKQRQRTSTTHPAQGDGAANGLMSRFGASLLHLRRKSMNDKASRVLGSKDLKPINPYRSLRVKQVEEKVSEFNRMTKTVRRSMINQMLPKKRLRARFNWGRVKTLLPSIAAIGRKRKEEEELSSAKLNMIGSLHAGEFIGHREIMRGETHAYTVIASTPCKYYTLHSDAVMKLSYEHPDIALQLQTALGCSIHCENQATAEKTLKRRKEAFKRGARENSTIVKLHSHGPNTATPGTMSSTLNVFAQMFMRLFRNGKGRYDERNVVVGVEGDEEAEERKKARTLTRHRKSIQNSLDSDPATGAVRWKSSQDLPLERHHDAASNSSLLGTGTERGTRAGPPLSNIPTTAAPRGASSVPTSTSVPVSRTLSLRLRERTAQWSINPIHLLTISTKKRRWSASSTIDIPLGLISAQTFVPLDYSSTVHRQSSCKGLRRYSI